jgi:AcrR family transcriptional regulator
MPRIRAESVPAHRALMETKLLDAFGEVMAERGYAELSLAEVAARAGMARNTVYNYAGDKEALLMDFVARAVATFVAETRAGLAELDDPADQLAELIARQMRQFRTEPGAGTDGGVMDGAMLGPESHGTLMARFAPLHELLAEVIEGGIAAGRFREVPVDRTVAHAFAVLGAERMPVATGEREPDEAAREVADFLLHALGA